MRLSTTQELLTAVAVGAATIIVVGLPAVVHGGLLRTSSTVTTTMKHNTNQRNNNSNNRQLQFFADFWSNPFQIAGVPITADQAELWCSDIWKEFVYCTIRECPDLEDKCPSSIFYSNVEQRNQDDLTLVDCHSVEKSYCDTYGADGCCMAKCSVEIQSLAACVIKGSGGRKLKCDAYDCQALADFEALVAAAEAAAAAEAEAAAEAAAQAEAEAAAAAQAQAEAEAAAAAQKEAEAAAAAQAEEQQEQQQQGKEEDKEEEGEGDEEEDTEETEVDIDGEAQQEEEGGNNVGKEKPFLDNFQVQLFADRDTVNALNGTRVSNGFFPMSFVEAMGRIFFQASGDGTGREIWVMNQARKSPHLLKDINKGRASSLDGMLSSESVELNGNLLFFANDGIHGKQLWKTNGLRRGTSMVRQIGNDSKGVSVRQNGKRSMIAYDGMAYFTLSVEGKEDELWVTDGTRNGTQPVGDSSSSLLPSGIKFDSLIQETLFDGTTYFVASDQRNSPSASSDLYVYVSDGADSTLQTVSKDVKVEETHEELVEFDGKIYFSAGTLSSTDGTEHGTREVVGPEGAFWNPRSLTVVRNILYFWSDCSLWSLNPRGGENTTFVLLFDGINTSSCSDELVKLHTKVLFRGGNQPYISDGTIAGTTQLSDATLITATSFVVYNNQLAFFVSETADGFGHELWATDGTIANTQVIPGFGINQPGLYPHIDSLFVFRKDVYISIWYLFGPGDEIWRARISGYEQAPVEIEEDTDGTTFEIMPSDLEDEDLPDLIDEVAWMPKVTNGNGP